MIQADEMKRDKPWSSFNIHDLVRVRTNLRSVGIPDYFVTDSVHPNLEIELVNHLKRPPPETVSREVGFTGYEVGKGELVYECDVPIMTMLGSRSRWRFMVSGLNEDATRVQTSVPFLDFAPVRHRIVELLSRLSRFIIALKLLQKGFSMCHGSSVSKGGKAVLLFGYGGTGKSKLATAMLDSGFEYMSDDSTIVDSKGEVYCYPDLPTPRSRLTRIPIFRYLVSEPPDRRLDGRIRNRSRIGPIIVLERGPDSVVEISRAEMASRLMLLNLDELSRLWNPPISAIVNQYSYFHPGLDLGRLMGRYRSCLASFVNHADGCFNVRSSSSGFEILADKISAIANVA